MNKRLSGVLAALFVMTAWPVQSALAMQSNSTTSATGIDVSHWDGTINWSQVAGSGVKFTYVKATEGTTFVDPEFSSNVQGAEASGVAVGAYHYAEPANPYSSSDAVQQAAFFVKTLKAAMPNGGDLMPVLDLETSNNLSAQDLEQWVQTFSNTVAQQINRQVMLYTGEWFLQQENFDTTLSGMPIWVAWYGYLNNNTVPPDLDGWTSWTAWQYADKGTVPGISAQVDMDYGPASLTSLAGNLPAPGDSQSGTATPVPAAITSAPPTAVPSGKAPSSSTTTVATPATSTSFKHRRFKHRARYRKRFIRWKHRTIIHHRKTSL